jgi:creatinine amidohydrolase
MQWENLTAGEFAAAVRQTGVCVIAMGVLERHSEHLPLGTDMLNGHRLACLAAEVEPAVVFPPFYFGQIYEARCFPGALTLKPTLLIELLQGVFDEIGRNGLHKIIVYSAHGGNNYLLPFLAQCSLWEAKPYTLYLPVRLLNPERAKSWQAILETSVHGHACECETSISLANHPHLVKMERLPQEAAMPLRRMKALPPTYAGIGWYSDYPEHYAGDARTATVEKGRALQQLQVEALAEYIAAVKADKVLPTLQQEFFRRVEQVRREEEHQQ